MVNLLNTLLTHLEVFWPSYGLIIIGPEAENHTSIASINSWHDSLDFAKVTVSLRNTLLTHLKVFWLSYGLLIKNQTSIASINSWHDALNFENAQQIMEHLSDQYQVVS